jgi:hypothetical protein
MRPFVERCLACEADAAGAVERCLACEADAVGTVEPAFLWRVFATIQFGKHN